MKKFFSILLPLALLCALPAFGEDVVVAATKTLEQCATLDDQLAVLDALATDEAAALDTPGWKESLIVPLTEELPADLLPGTDAPEGVSTLPEALAGARFIAVYQRPVKSRRNGAGTGRKRPVTDAPDKSRQGGFHP